MPNSSTHKFLVVRLGALGDIMHTVPAVAALRQAYPEARLDWAVQERWADLVALVVGVDNIIPVRRTFTGMMACVRELRRTRYDWALDFQGLYKSATLPWMAGIPRRIGRDRRSAREPACAFFYSEHVRPVGTHVAEMSLSMAQYAGAKGGKLQFPMRVPEAELRGAEAKLRQEGISDYVLVSPGGGWKSKCWPAERFGGLCEQLWRKHGIRSIINAGPREEDLARTAAAAAPTAKPLVLRPASLLELAAISARARVVVAADTGPLHLASALGSPVVGLFGPTSPERNGPVPRGRVVRNLSLAEAEVLQGSSPRGDYLRGKEISPAMLSLTVEQVLAGVEEEMSVRA